jgi:hypothetical protein
MTLHRAVLLSGKSLLTPPLLTAIASAVDLRMGGEENRCGREKGAWRYERSYMDYIFFSLFAIVRRTRMKEEEVFRRWK